MKTRNLLKLGVVAAASYGVVRALKRSQPVSDVDSKFDTSDIDASSVHDISEIADTTDVDAPVVVTEEVVVITEAGPYEVELELIPASGRFSR